MEPTYRIAQRLHERRAAKGLLNYGQHLTANSPGCMLVHAVEEAADLTEYLLAEVQRRKIVLKTLNELSKEMHAELAIGWAYKLEKLYDLLGGKSAIEQYDEILGGGTVAQNATVDPRDEALRVATEALEQALKLDQTCDHADLVRLGAIWTKCEDCGKEWVDDEGGFQPDGPNEIVEKIQFALAAIRAAWGAR